MKGLLVAAPPRFATYGAVWGVAGLAGAAAALLGTIPMEVGVGFVAGCGVLGIAQLVVRGNTAEKRCDIDRHALAIGGDGTWVYDLRRGTITYDDRCAQMLGYDRGHIADRLSAWGKLVHPEDLDRARTALDDYLEGRADAYSVDVRLRDVRGCWRRIADRGRIVQRGSDGKPSLMVGIHRLLANPDQDVRPHDTLDSDEEITQVERKEVTPVPDVAEIRPPIAEPQIELVPLAAIVDGFAGPGVTIGVDLPVIDADPTLLLGAVTLVVNALSPSRSRKLFITRHPRAALAFKSEGPVDTEAPQLRAARALLTPMQATLETEGNIIRLVTR